MAVDDKMPVYFNKAGAARIAAMAKRVEASPRNEPAPRAAGPRGGTLVAVQVAKTGASGIGAMSGSTVGIGNVTLYTCSEAGVLTALAGYTAIPARNLGGAIAADKFVLLSEGPWGWWITAVVC